MLALHERDKVVREGLRAIQAVYENGRKASNEYYRAVFILTWQYFDIEAIDEALELVYLIPPEYFLGEFVKQADADPLFGKLAVKVVNLLVKRGIITEVDYITNEPVQPVGEA